MPNHFHGIVIINPVGANVNVRAKVGSPLRQPSMKPKSLSSLMAGFKSSVTKKINSTRNTPGAKIWQRNYYEHIICDRQSCHKIRQYIVSNPLSWEKDQLHPDCPSKW